MKKSKLASMCLTLAMGISGCASQSGSQEIGLCDNLSTEVCAIASGVAMIVAVQAVAN